MVMAITVAACRGGRHRCRRVSRGRASGPRGSHDWVDFVVAVRWPRAAVIPVMAMAINGEFKDMGKGQGSRRATLWTSLVHDVLPVPLGARS